MGIVRVSIYQKALNEGLNLTILKKLSALKSDFLLLPEYFYADQGVRDQKALIDKSQYALDWLLKLNETYKGVILAGGVARDSEREGQRYFSAPVVYDGQLVDYYDKRRLSPAEASFGEPAPEEHPSVFILGGYRFGVLAGADAADPERLKLLAKQGVRILFLLSSGPEFQKSSRIDGLMEASREHDLYISLCCATGSLLGDPASGRSLVITPAGVSWRVSEQESDKEILKTVLVNVPGNTL